jgi:hypothetical protein
MQIQNKLEKFLMGVSSIFLVVATVLGIKIADDNKKIGKLESSLNDYNSAMANILETQKQIIAGRESILANLAIAPAPSATNKVTTQTVVPGRTIAQQVPVSSTAGSSSAKSVASSSASSAPVASAPAKKTKTS